MCSFLVWNRISIRSFKTISLNEPHHMRSTPSAEVGASQSCFTNRCYRCFTKSRNVWKWEDVQTTFIGMNEKPSPNTFQILCLSFTTEACAYFQNSFKWKHIQKHAQHSQRCTVNSLWMWLFISGSIYNILKDFLTEKENRLLPKQQTDWRFKEYDWVFKSSNSSFLGMQCGERQL